VNSRCPWCYLTIPGAIVQPPSLPLSQVLFCIVSVSLFLLSVRRYLSVSLIYIESHDLCAFRSALPSIPFKLKQEMLLDDMVRPFISLYSYVR
jgi:hypothetical protein